MKWKKKGGKKKKNDKGEFHLCEAGICNEGLLRREGQFEGLKEKGDVRFEIEG